MKLHFDRARVEKYFDSLTQELKTNTNLYWKLQKQYCLNGDINYNFTPIGNTSIQKLNYTSRFINFRKDYFICNYYILENNTITIYFDYRFHSNLNIFIFEQFFKLIRNYIEENIHEESIEFICDNFSKSKRIGY